MKTYYTKIISSLSNRYDDLLVECMNMFKRDCLRDMPEEKLKEFIRIKEIKVMRKEPYKNTLTEYTDGTGPRPRRNNTFYTEVLKNLRKGQADYVFTQEHVDELRSKIQSNEELVALKRDGFIIVSLIVKEEY